MESIMKLYQYKKIQNLIDEDSGEELNLGLSMKGKLVNIKGEIDQMEKDMLKSLIQHFNK